MLLAMHAAVAGFVLSVPLCAAQPIPAVKYPPGLPVSEVEKGLPADRAGLKPGDVILTFAGSPLRFPSQVEPLLDKARYERRPSLLITIRRGASERSLDVTVGTHIGVTIFSPFSASIQARLAELDKVPKDSPSALVTAVKPAADAALAEHDPRAAATIWRQAADILDHADAERQVALTNALTCAGSAGDTLLAAACLVDLSALAERAGRHADEAAFSRRALAICRRDAPGSMLLAISLTNSGSALLDEDKLEEAEPLERTAIAIKERLDPNSSKLALSLAKLGQIEFHLNRVKDAEQTVKRALVLENGAAPTSTVAAACHSLLGQIEAERGELATAQDQFELALDIAEHQDRPDNVLGELIHLAVLAANRGDLQKAKLHGLRALKVGEQPGASRELVARSLASLILTSEERGELDEADRYIDQALKLLDTLPKASESVADVLRDIAQVLHLRGRLGEAADLYSRAIAIRQKGRLDLQEMASLHDGLGSVLAEFGDLGAADEYLILARRWLNEAAPTSLESAFNFNALGLLALRRGQAPLAQTYFLQALAMRERAAPQSIPTAESLNNIAVAELQENDYKNARAVLKESIKIKEKLSPESLGIAASLANLSDIALHDGNLPEANANLDRARKIVERLAPGSLQNARILYHLGEAARQGDSPSAARNYFSRSLTICEHVAAESDLAADNLMELSSLAEGEGNLDSALELVKRAVKIVDAQGIRINGDVERHDFEQRFIYAPRALVRLELAKGRPTQAFEAAEHARVQALVQAVRDGARFGRAPNDKAWEAFRMAQGAYFNAQQELDHRAIAVSRAEAEYAKLRDEGAPDADLAQARRTMEAARDALEIAVRQNGVRRQESESFWTVVRDLRGGKLPNEVPIDTARRSLAADTVLLEYVVSEQAVTLFVVTRSAVLPVTLAAKREALEAEITHVRQVVSRSSDERSATLVTRSNEEVSALRRLFAELFPPQVQEAIRGATRLVLSPDGKLWNVPFAALITNGSGEPAYLGLTTRLAYAQSLTLFASSSADAARGQGALIIGNPVYDESRRARMVAATKAGPANASKTVAPMRADRRLFDARALSLSGEAPKQLAYAQEEARKVAELYHSVPHTGVEPTEAWFRQHAGQAKIIHLATHGFLNPIAPESGGILLAVPGPDDPIRDYSNDGALLAWEIPALRLKADMVVLSACETGLGNDVEGGGLIGLTRAFQIAGAKSIVASQWKVADASTAALMTAFHRNLIAGRDRDEALRLAMVEIAKREDLGWNAPYYWAPFVLVGETGPIPK